MSGGIRRALAEDTWLVEGLRKGDAIVKRRRTDFALM